MIIPATDTPGAIGAGVPAFIRQMLAEWGSQRRAPRLPSVLEAIEKQAWSKFGAAFLEIARRAAPRSDAAHSMRQSLARSDGAYAQVQARWC